MIINIQWLSAVVSLKRVTFYPKLLRSAIGIAANNRHLFRVADVHIVCESVDRSMRIHYIREHVRILIPPRQLLACLLVCPFACLLMLVVAWLPYRILTHIHVPLPRDRAQVTGLGYRRSGVPDTFQCIEFAEETDIAIPILPIARSRFNPFQARNSSWIFPLSRGIFCKIVAVIIFPHRA